MEKVCGNFPSVKKAISRIKFMPCHSGGRDGSKFSILSSRCRPQFLGYAEKSFQEGLPSSIYAGDWKKTSSVDELRILKFSWNYSSINYATKIGRDKSIFPCLYRFSALAMALPPVAGFAEFVPESAGLRYSKIWWFFLKNTCAKHRKDSTFCRL